MTELKPEDTPFILNCVNSDRKQADWSTIEAVDGDLLNLECELKSRLDLRRKWWPVSNQHPTGACVGYAVADGVLRFLYEKHGLMTKKQKPSVRFIWMANKETDDLTKYPTTFLERAGTSTKLALKVVKKYGCVEDSILPMTSKDGLLNKMNVPSFFTEAAKYRIKSYINLRSDGEIDNDKDALLRQWKCWMNQHGPILTRLDVDTKFRFATPSQYKLDSYRRDSDQNFGGHAVCIVGYTTKNFIIRNSWGQDWGKNGFALVSYQYAFDAFNEAYGVIM